MNYFQIITNDEIPPISMESVTEIRKQFPKFRERQVHNFQVPGTSSFEIKKLTKNVFSYFNKKYFRYLLLPFQAL